MFFFRKDLFPMILTDKTNLIFMKSTFLFFFIHLHFFCPKTSATPVITDLLIVDTDTFHLYTFQLEDYFVMKDDHNLGDEEVVGSGIWSLGYMATWRIEKSDLYLVDLRLANYENNIFSNCNFAG